MSYLSRINRPRNIHTPEEVQQHQPLNLDMEHMAIALLQELVHATPDISAEREPLYVGLINDLRNDRNLDP